MELEGVSEPQAGEAVNIGRKVVHFTGEWLIHLGWWKWSGWGWLHLRSGCGPTTRPVGLAVGGEEVDVVAEAV